MFYVFLSLCILSIGSSSLIAMEGYRAHLLHFLDDPAKGEKAIAYFEDGLLLVEEGKIVDAGSYEKLALTYDLEKKATLHSYRDALIVPGFIDTHIHFPQVDMIASYGEQLLEWLQKYTFPHEKLFWDKAYADQMAEKFVEELLRNGTTSALVFASASKASAEAMFQSAEKRNMRVISGISLGDRHLPDHLLKSQEACLHETQEMIANWHHKGRLQYAITPRFALTSSDEQLKLIGELLKTYPDVYLHTHLSENKEETAWVQELFPWSSNYLDVYDHYGLVRPRSVFAHSIHLSDAEIARLAQTGASVSFCPTSNLFLGSGFFRWKPCKEAGVLIGLGTDVGAGTSFSMLSTMGEGYKVTQLQKHRFTPFEAFYHATLGGARALAIDEYVGNFETGKEADFVVLNLNSTPLLAFRMQASQELLDRLFLLMILGDDRSVAETYIFGKCQYKTGSK